MEERVLALIEFYKLSNGVFADVIGVKRSSISHIISKRNKPSLDFVTKILKTYPEVNSEWLLFGEGEMFKEKIQPLEKQEPSETIEAPLLFLDDDDFGVEKSSSEQDTIDPSPMESTKKTLDNSPKKPIKKVLFFYEDGTFEEFCKN